MEQEAQRQVQISINRAEVTLDDNSVETLRKLFNMTSEFHQSTLNVERIQRGSPRAGELGTAVRKFHRDRFEPIFTKFQDTLNRYGSFPGMNVLSMKLNKLDQTLQERFNDRGNEDGYRERVDRLEKFNYINGMLHSAVEMIIEHHEYWENKIANNQRLARRLDFNPDINPGPVNAQAPRVAEGQAVHIFGALAQHLNGENTQHLDAGGGVAQPWNGGNAQPLLDGVGGGGGVMQPLNGGYVQPLDRGVGGTPQIQNRGYAQPLDGEGGDEVEEGDAQPLGGVREEVAQPQDGAGGGNAGHLNQGDAQGRERGDVQPLDEGPWCCLYWQKGWVIRGKGGWNCGYITCAISRCL